MGIFNKKEKENNDMPAFYELSLKKVIISGDVFGKFGKFTVEQTFKNERTKPLEVSYTFPITETAAVTGFTVKVDDKVMHGVCKEKEEAKKEYIENLQKGNSAYLLNQDTGNVFDVLVGKVLPGEEVNISISYLDIFTAVDNNVRLIIPTFVFPRYKSALTDGLNYGKVAYTVDFKINVHKTLHYTDITSINHQIDKKENEEAITITADNYDMSKDFVLDMKFKDDAISNAYYSKTKDGKIAVLLSFMPEIEETEDSEKEYIFVVDVSGSMGGLKIDKTKEALKRCLKELDAGDRFNILPFESKYTFYKPESIEATEENIEDAIKFVDTLRASGGTEILSPLQFALYEKSDDKVVIVLTDGEVGNEDEITSFVSKNIFNSKLFAFGIDNSVNTAFLRALAKAGNGKAEFIYPNEKMDDAILRTFERIQSPLVKNVKVDYGKNKLLDEIKDDNTLFNYEFYQVAALLEKLEDDIVLRGEIDGKELSWKISKEDIVENDGTIDLVFAKKSIDKLDEQIASYANDWRNKNAKEMKEQYKAKVVEISTKYNIASKYTSFISVNEREEKVFEPTEFENVTLSDAELGDFVVERCMAAPKTGYLGEAKVKKMKMDMCGAISPMKDYDIMETEEEYVLNDNVLLQRDYVEPHIKDLQTLDVFTFLLMIIYIYEGNFGMDIEKEVKEYFKRNPDKLVDENVQKLLMYMYQQYMINKNLAEELLQGIYKKFVVTNATLDMDFLDDLEFDEDHSIELDNGSTLRDAMRGDLRI